MKRHDAAKRRDKLKAKLFSSDPRCRYCCRVLKHPKYATIDHMIPRGKGGGNEVSNKTLACKQCNQNKGDSLPVGKWAPKFLP